MRALSHGIECQEVILSDLKIIFEELHASFEVAAQGVLVGDSKHYHTSAVMVCKVNSFRDLASCNGEEDCSSAIVTGLLVVLKSHDGLEVVFGFNVDELVLTHLLQNAHLIPLNNDVLHVLVGGEETNYAIRYY